MNLFESLIKDVSGLSYPSNVYVETFNLIYSCFAFCVLDIVKYIRLSFQLYIYIQHGSFN